MKKLLLLTAFVLLLSFSVQAQGFNALTSFTGGLGLEKGQSTDFMYAGGFDAPVVTKQGNYQIATEVTYLYSDRSFEEVGEIEALRTVVSGKKFLKDSSAFYLALGAGTWNLLNTGGENKTLPLLNASFGAEFLGIDTRAGCDFVRKDGADIYYLNLGVRILHL